MTRPNAMGTVFDLEDDTAADDVSERVEPASIVADMLCVGAFSIGLIALLLVANSYIADLVERNADLRHFMLSPWVAPVLIGCGIALIGGIAALLLHAADVSEPGEGA